jgi:hypothetical protein
MMNLIEFNDKLLVNNERVVYEVPAINQESIDDFRKVVNSSRSMAYTYETLEDVDAFMKLYPGIKKLYGSALLSELFYASKLNQYYEGIPSKLIYVLTKLFKEFGTVHINDTLSRGLKYLTPFINHIYVVNGQDLTLKDVIDVFAKGAVKLLTSSVRKVKAVDCYEVFIPNANRVALLPNDIANQLPYADCEKLSFDRNRGIVMDDLVVRTMSNRLGVTKDDFDLRQCI